MARILVVDDQPQILKMLESLLTQRGHIVSLAKDAFDALERVKVQPFEMVITDAIMPGGASGFDLVKTLRADNSLKSLLIILLTGKREKKDVARGIQAGVDDYAVKPVDPDLFLAKVEALLQKKFNGSVAFAEASVSLPATFTNSLTLVGVSEVGLSFNSTQPLHVGSKIELASDFFQEVGMGIPNLRVMTCEALPNSGNYLVRVQYIGLTEASLQPLRVWIRSKNLPKAG